MKYFLDTEFIEDGKTIDLISIGVICEDGRAFYRCSADADLTRADEWVRENVLIHLPPARDPAWVPRWVIKNELAMFLANYDHAHKDPVEIWAYYADYDWVALCQLFGRMLDLPSFMPKYCNDIKQLFEQMGGKEKVGHLKPPEPANVHDALADAIWNMRFYRSLVGGV